MAVLEVMLMTDSKGIVEPKRVCMLRRVLRVLWFGGMEDTLLHVECVRDCYYYMMISLPFDSETTESWE